MVLIRKANKGVDSTRTSRLLTLTLIVLAVALLWAGLAAMKLLRVTARPSDDGDKETASMSNPMRPAVVGESRRGTATEFDKPITAADEPAPALDVPPEELRDHLQQQNTILRKELLDNVGRDNGLTATKEEIEAIARDGAVVF